MFIIIIAWYTFIGLIAYISEKEGVTVKVLQYKVSRSTLLLIFNMVLVLTSALLILVNLQSRKELENSKRGFYSENASYLVYENGDWESMLDILTGEKWTDGILYKKSLEMESDTRGVFYQGKIKKPALLSGRFFTEEESSGNERKALIGKRFQKDTFEKNGKEYIEILGETFEVIGILGSEQPTRLDSMKWIPMKTAVELTGAEGSYVSDGISKEKIVHNTKLLWKIMDEDWTMKESEMEATVRKYSKGWQNSVVEKIYLAIVFSFILNTILAGGYWICQKKQKVQVEKILGFSNSRIIQSILVEYMIIAAVSGMITLCLFVVIRAANAITAVR